MGTQSHTGAINATELIKVKSFVFYLIIQGTRYESWSCKPQSPCVTKGWPVPRLPLPTDPVCYINWQDLKEQWGQIFSFGNVRILFLLLKDEVVLLALSDHDIQYTLGGLQPSAKQPGWESAPPSRTPSFFAGKWWIDWDQVSWIPPEHLPSEVFQTCPTGRRHQGGPWAWRNEEKYISSGLRTPWDSVKNELEKDDGERDIWSNLLSLLPQRPNPRWPDEYAWMDEWLDWYRFCVTYFQCWLTESLFNQSEMLPSNIVVPLQKGAPIT